MANWINRQGIRWVTPALLMMWIAMGCASTVKTTTVRTETHRAIAPETPAAAAPSDAPAPRQTEEITTTTTTTTEKEKESDGILTNAFRTIGSIIAFPFRVVGAALGALF